MCLIVLMGCSESETDNNAGFELTSKAIQEDDGSVQIKVLLDRAVDQSGSLYFEFDGEAALNGDFKLITPSPITIESGSREAVIEIEALDEFIIEPSEDLILTITAAGGTGILLPESKSEFTLTIEDNDEAPEEGIQVDLTWSNDSERDIDEFDLDLFIANNVTIVDDQVEDFEVYSKSENQIGFETAWLDQDAPDGEYYLVAYYQNGNKDVDFMLEINGPGFERETTDGDFESDETGMAIFFGPITKDGSSISRAVTPSEKMIWKKYIKAN